ncbi:MAG: 6-phosphofructokinase [Planctomycetaceae bacterium]|nr:6-phosphofructokinase [Planctomycetaceae bacterium]
MNEAAGQKGSDVKRIGLVTGGGDCPGLNAVIRAIVLGALNRGWEVFGIERGFEGLLYHDRVYPMNRHHVKGIIHTGGTILGTTNRGNPFSLRVVEDGVSRQVDVSHRVVEEFHRLGLEALVVIGGDGTLRIASSLAAMGIPIIGVPKTIDNDLSSTDFTFGFDTCLNTVMDAVDKLRTTAESHRRIIVVECMGRHAGWITAFSGMAVAADAIMVPEKETLIDDVCELLKARRTSGKKYGIVMVSEGATIKFRDESGNIKTLDVSQSGRKDDFGHIQLGGIGKQVAELIKYKTGIETREVVLGHLQRGGSPSAYDRVLGTRLGVHAGRLALKKDFGKMVALRGMNIVAVPLAEAVGQMRTLPLEFLDEAGEFLR